MLRRRARRGGCVWSVKGKAQIERALRQRFSHAKRRAVGVGEADGTLGQVKIIEQGIAAGDRVAAQQLFDEQRALRCAFTDGAAGLAQGTERTAAPDAPAAEGNTPREAASDTGRAELDNLLV